MEPIRSEDGVLVFSIDQIYYYGEPYIYGFENYIVVGERVEPSVTPLYIQENIVVKQRHRYSRYARFKSILLRLIGERGSVPDWVVREIKQYGDWTRNNPKIVWDEVRYILKKTDNSRFYNMIPIILNKLGYGKHIRVGGGDFVVKDILEDFERISRKFDALPKKGRIYFPELRYIALKYLHLERYNVEFEYHIPMFRTPRKVKVMDAFWKKLY